MGHVLVLTFERNVMNTQVELRASVNEAAFIKNLRTLFSGSTSYLGELIQNSRRAGATRIAFTHTDSKLVCEDNGGGLEDFAKLLTFAESGWNNEVTAQDNPFGMGVFSYFFAADQVIFESLGQQITVECAELLNGGAVLREKVPNKAGTRITFVGLKEPEVNQKLRNLVRGFSVPVFYNEVELPRDHALDTHTFVKTDVGMLRAQLTTGNVAMYLQGLPIGGLHSFGSEAIHLDTHAFEAQMPDRHMLYNQHEALKVIREVIRKDRVRQLYEAKAVQTAVDFVSSFKSLAISLEAEEIFNDVKAISNAQGSKAVAWLSDSSYYFNALSEQQLENWLLITDVPDLQESHKSFMLHNLGLEHDVLKLKLHEDHWLHEKAIHFDDLKIELIVGGTVNTATIQSVDVRMVKSLAYKVTGPEGFEKIYPITDYVLSCNDQSEEDGLEIDPESDCEVIVLEGCLSSPHLCLSPFTDEHNVFQDDWADESENAWIAGLQKLNGLANFATNIHNSIRQSGAVTQDIGDMAVFQSTDNAWYPKHANMNDEWFAKVASAMDVDPVQLKAAIQAAF